MAKRSDNPPDDDVATSEITEKVLAVLEAAGCPTHINDQIADKLDKLLVKEAIPADPPMITLTIGGKPLDLKRISPRPGFAVEYNREYVFASQNGASFSVWIDCDGPFTGVGQDWDSAAKDFEATIAEHVNVILGRAGLPLYGAPSRPEPEADMNQIATEWAEARDVIALALTQVTGGRANQDHNAAAIIARLSHAGFSLEKGA